MIDKNKSPSIEVHEFGVQKMKIKNDANSFSHSYQKPELAFSHFETWSRPGPRQAMLVEMHV